MIYYETVELDLTDLRSVDGIILEIMFKEECLHPIEERTMQLLAPLGYKYE